MKFKPTFEKQKEEKSALETKAQAVLTLAEQLTSYSEREHYTYTDLQEAVREIILALQEGNKGSALQATEDLIGQYGRETCNLGTLHDQLKQENKDTDQTEIEQQAQHIRDEQHELAKKVQNIVDTKTPNTFLSSLKQNLKHITDKAKYAVAIAVLINSVTIKGIKIEKEMQTIEKSQLTHLVREIMNPNADPDTFSRKIFAEGKFKREHAVRLELNTLFNLDSKGNIFSDNKKLSLHRQIDQQYQDPPLEEILNKHEEVGDIMKNFFLWVDLNPETKIKVIYTILESGVVDESIFDEISQVIANYYFYPEAKSVFNAIVKKYPLILLEGKFTSHISAPTECITKMIEQLPFAMFQKNTWAFKEKIMRAAINKNRSAGLSIVGAIVEKIKKEFPISIEILERQEEKQITEDGYLFRMLNYIESLERFLRDPTLPLTKSINPNWIPTEDVDTTDAFCLAEHQLMIARNLYFQGIQSEGEITEDMVKQASREIIQRRVEVRDTPLFKDREVIVFAGDEMRNNERVFGRIDTLEEVRRQMASSVELFSPDRTHTVDQFMSIAEVEQIKQKVETIKTEGLENIASTIGKLTIMLEGHGSPDGKMHLVGGYHAAMQGSTETWNCITPSDLADALNKRWHMLQEQITSGGISEQEAREPAIITYMSCFGSNQMRMLYERLDPEVPKPYCIAGSEHGMPMTGYDSPFSSTHTEGSILQIDRGGPATMGGAVEETMRKESLYQGSNPVIYIPRKEKKPNKPFEPKKDNIPMQISLGETLESAGGAV